MGADVSVSAVLEVGPVGVRRVDGEFGATLSAHETAMAAVALGGIDDPFVLFDEQPVAVIDLWRRLFRSIAGDGADSIVIVHPSSWPRRRVDVVDRAAAGVAADVAALARRNLIDSPGGAVVEFGADAIAVSAGSAITVLGRDDLDGVVGFIASASPSDCVAIDAPPELPGVVRDGMELRGRLERNGFRSHDLDIVALARSLTRPAPTAGRNPRRRQRVSAASAAALLIGVILSAAVAIRPEDAGPQSDSTESLVEGRVAVGVPAHWTIDRITGGPGSRRVQVTSPVNPEVALHITQAYAPGSDLADAARILARAVAGQPDGTFVDFADADEVAGRPAVTYREIRDGHVVRWAVLVDGATRIGIGCQSPPRGEEDVRGACEQAIRTARERQ